MIHIEQLSKRYTPDGPAVIDQLSFHLNPRDKMCLFAPSGAGKSTLLRILMELDPRYQGRYQVNSRRKGIVFQDAGLFSYMTVRENILYPFRLTKQKPSSASLEEMEAWLNLLELQASLGLYPFQLSGGMRHKVAIIRAMLQHPDVVFWDEPFRSIDFKTKVRIGHFLQERYQNLTSILVTHTLEDISLFANQLYYFRDKRLNHYTVFKVDHSFHLDQLIQMIESETFQATDSSDPRG